ncbi:uncharacterized protein BN611_01356 [Ruminococcus sp. CAG:330]|nr:uncharacterized protein BN611_01356 [Ruminococcus sp. CAG:330]
MEKWSDSADGLTAKITQLKGVNQSYDKILAEYEQKLAQIVSSEGENSEAAQNMQIKINNLKAAIKGNEAAIEKHTKALADMSNESDDSAGDTEDLAGALDETGDEAKTAEKKLDGVNDEIKETGEKSEESTGKLKNFLGSLGKGILTGIGAAATGLAAGLTAATEESKEFTDNMNKLSSAAKDGGYSADFAQKSFENMYGVLGDETAANTTVSNFMAMGTSTENLNSLLNSSAGIWAKYGDSIPLDGLAESVNETAKVGQITGNLADALNWAGVNEDDFNTSLSECSDEQERQQLIVDTLNGLYGSLGQEYQKNNQAMIDLNEAQMEMKTSIAQIGTAFAPVLAMFTQMGAGLLSSLVPDVQNLASAFTDLVNGVDGAGEKIGTSVGNILTNLVTKLTSALPTIATVGVTIVQSLVSGIVDNSEEILSSASDVIMTLADGIVTLAPQLLTSIVTLVANIADELITLAPELLDAGIELFDGLITALTDLDLGNVLSNLITTLVTTLTKSTPKILNGATKLFMGIVSAIPVLLNQLLPQLPKIINMVTGFLIAAIPQILEAAMTMLHALIDALPQIIDALVEALPEIISALTEFLHESIPELLDAGIELLMAIVDALPTIIDSLVDALPTIITTLVDFFIDNIDVIFDAAIKLLMALVDAIPDILVELGNELPKIVGAILKAIVDAVPKLLAKSRELFGKVMEALGELLRKLPGRMLEVRDSVVNGIQNSISRIREAAGEIADAILEHIKELPGEMFNAGRDIVEGLWNGINDMVGWIGDKISGFGDSVLSGIKDFFGIHSPSLVMEKQVGKFLPMGLAKGIKDKTAVAVDAMKTMGQKMLAPAQNLKENLAVGAGETRSAAKTIVQNFNQNVYSPKALSRLEIYRQSKNLLKGARV